MDQICVQWSGELDVVRALILKPVMNSAISLVWRRVSGRLETRANGGMLVSASDGARSTGRVHGKNHPGCFKDLERSWAKSSTAKTTRSRASKTLCSQLVSSMLLTIWAIVLVLLTVGHFIIIKNTCRYFMQVLGIAPVSEVSNEHLASENSNF